MNESYVPSVLHWDNFVNVFYLVEFQFRVFLCIVGQIFLAFHIFANNYRAKVCETWDLSLERLSGPAAGFYSNLPEAVSDCVKSSPQTSHRTMLDVIGPKSIGRWQNVERMRFYCARFRAVSRGCCTRRRMHGSQSNALGAQRSEKPTNSRCRKFNRPARSWHHFG
jgi:hypothetical protein